MQNDGAAATRSVAPRWRSLENTPQIELLASQQLKRTHALDRTLHDLAIKRWQNSGTLEDAAEVIDGVVMFGISDEATAAALQILEADDAVMPMVQNGAQKILGLEDLRPQIVQENFSSVEQIRRQIRDFKARLKLYPRDSVTAMEVARLHSVLGQTDRARRYVEIATSISRDNRFVIRSASRFYTHIGRPDAAFALINSGDAVRTDPWVQAAEVSICTQMEKSPRWGTKNIKTISNSKKLATRFSELAAGLAYLEFENGSTRSSRKLLRSSLQNPTENTVAEAVWLETNHRIGIDPALSIQTTPNAFEAAVLNAAKQRDAKRTIRDARHWLKDEPYSVGPALAGSFYCASHFHDHDGAIKFADAGLRANPGNKDLLNNKLVALVYDGRLSQARDILQSLEKHKNDPQFRPRYLAAKGLLAYRQGQIEQGRYHYFGAIVAAQNNTATFSTFLAYAHWVEQEILFGAMDSAFASKVIDHLDAEISKLDKGISVNCEFTWSAMRDRMDAHLTLDDRNANIAVENDSRLLETTLLPLR